MTSEDLLNSGWTIEPTLSAVGFAQNERIQFTKPNDTFTITIGNQEWANSCVFTTTSLSGFTRDNTPFYVRFGDPTAHKMTCYSGTASRWPKWLLSIGLSAVLGAVIGGAAKVTTGAPLSSAVFYIAAAVGGSLITIIGGLHRVPKNTSTVIWVAEDGSGQAAVRQSPGPRAIRAGAARA